MVLLSTLLHRIHHVHEAPPETYILYNLNGGIFFVHVRDYPTFAHEWIALSTTSILPSLTMDLASASTHALIFDLDCRTAAATDSQVKAMVDVIETVLKMTFLPTISHFTYIVAMRQNGPGFHIHLPEFRIGHDDYILLCEMLQQKLQQVGYEGEYTLDILANAMLPGAAKPHCLPYTARCLLYADEQRTVHLTLAKFESEYGKATQLFVKRKHNETSLFRSLLKLSNQRMLENELRHLMMPVVVATTLYTTAYNTSIGKQPNRSPDWCDVATFTYKQSGEPGYVCKSKTLGFHASSPARVFHHLRLNASNMTDLVTANRALKTWYERFGHGVSDAEHISPMFRDLHETLRYEHADLADDPNPLKTLMQSRQGHFFLPVFYALCQHFQTLPEPMARHLRPLLDPDFYPLLEVTGAIDPQNVHCAMSELSVNTLHYCANNLLHSGSARSHRDVLQWIVGNHRRAILSVTTADQLSGLLRTLQDRHLPIYVLRLRNALKKPSRYVWNALSESWQEVASEREVQDHLQNLWNSVKQFCLDHRASGALGGPDEELLQKFSVQTVVSSILSDTAMERKDIQMDAHKWLLRLQDGCVLDLLTGHVGGVVPEWFLSDRKILLGSECVARLCQHSGLQQLYVQLVDRRFFQQVLQALFLDRAPNLLDALRGALGPFKEGGEEEEEMALSMLNFYVNLCKCTSFEYDLLLYMLDVLASVLIGTNYMRKFFVWKGVTRNGKSKLFELMSKVLGGYYHAIQSENLTPGGHAANNATPELASTLFSCRMVTTEELDKRLDENRVKQITGNSFVTFRNMYEQSSGGIPTAKVFATTNNYPECKASEAFKDRVRAIPFDAEFSDTAPALISEQVERNVYPKEVHVVEASYRGGFFLLYYHLKRCMDPRDGLLYYRKEPECVLEFTQDYLVHADFYVQFKLHMDVQWKPGTQTTLNDVRSAVRQYLKATKNTSFHESDLLMAFEREYGHARQTDIQISGGGGGESFSYTSMAEPKRARVQQQQQQDASLVFYEGVVIKNLKRSNLDDY